MGGISVDKWTRSIASYSKSPLAVDGLLLPFAPALPAPLLSVSRPARPPLPAAPAAATASACCCLSASISTIRSSRFSFCTCSTVVEHEQCKLACALPASDPKARVVCMDICIGAAPIHHFHISVIICSG